MAQKLGVVIIALCALMAPYQAQGMNAEVFGKVSGSRSYSRADTYTLTLSGAGGLALLIIPQIRLEGRYTLHRYTQNQLLDQGLKDIITQTNIYSLGLDIDIVSEKNAVRPFILIGAGYLQSWTQFTDSETGDIYVLKREGISANAGAGFRIRIAKSVAFEIEGFAYATDPHKPNPLIDFYANAGIRIFL